MLLRSRIHQLVLPVGPGRTSPVSRVGKQHVPQRNEDEDVPDQPVLSRRAFGRLAAGAATATGAGALSVCSGGSGRPSADAPSRFTAINQGWPQAVKRRTAEFEKLIGRRAPMTLLTADQLAGNYSVELNASGTDVDVMMVRALQEQLLFGPQRLARRKSGIGSAEAVAAYEDYGRRRPAPGRTTFPPGAWAATPSPDPRSPTCGKSTRA